MFRSLVFFCIALSYGHLVQALSYSVRHKRQIECSNHEYLCQDGRQCVDHESVCDGIVNCRDGSDETFTLCSHNNFTCASYAFKCSYGACVDGDSKCNGKNDCADGSDELLAECNGVVSAVENKNCKLHQFACFDKRECVDFTNVCDGTKNCQDGSDETLVQCSQLKCEPFTFRCAYGACVDGDYLCDGTPHCADGSDEFAPQCNKSAVALPISVTESPAIVSTTDLSPGSQTGCIVPEIPENGGYSSPSCSSSSCNLTPGQVVSDRWLLMYQCSDGFRLKGERFAQCVDGSWTFNAPQCLPADRCEAVTSEKFLLICLNRQRGIPVPVPCNRPVPNGTQLKFRCNPVTYTKISEPGYDTIVCRNGEWSRPLPELICQPECGKAVSDEGRPVIGNGVRTKYAEFPWHAGVYEREYGTDSFLQNCGGTIVSKQIIISAAHCFYDERIGSRELFAKSLDDLRIVVGKYWRTFNSSDDSLAQVHKIKEIIIPPEYSGQETNYECDIAVVKTNEDIVYSYAVRPVCLDIGQFTFEEDQLQSGAMGKVVGWGMTENKTFSESLLLANMPFVPRDQCKRKVSQDFAQYITSDKFCAGDFVTRVGVCPGDSGGGLVFENNSTHRFYLRGVVSLGARDCASQQYALFTRISKYSHFINGEV